MIQSLIVILLIMFAVRKQIRYYDQLYSSVKFRDVIYFFYFSMSLQQNILELGYREKNNYFNIYNSSLRVIEFLLMIGLKGYKIQQIYVMQLNLYAFTITIHAHFMQQKFVIRSDYISQLQNTTLSIYLTNINANTFVVVVQGRAC